MNSDIIQSNKLLFICANPGSGGYRLSRIISCLDNVFWYSNGRNGIYPWTVYNNSRVAGKEISEYHYDRYIGHQMVPLVGERIESYWNADDLDNYYNNIWADKMLSSGATSITKNNMYISWVVHDLPDYILARFPNAKIINLIDDDIDVVVNRYLETTALFPIILRNTDIKPVYKTEHAVLVDRLTKTNKLATYRDLWAIKYKNVHSYSNLLFDQEFKQYLENMFNYLHNIKLKRNPSYYSTSWSSFNVDEIKSYLGSNIIENNYQLLL
jgi:hypothetical protein